MAAQLALPGMAESELAEALAEKERLKVAWLAVATIPPGADWRAWTAAVDWDELSRLQREYFAALKRVEQLTLGPCWWH